jgi:K+-sensing histidine kinase KdpD
MEEVGLMTRYLTRDTAAIAAAILGPLVLAAILLPWRGSWSNTNVALLLVVAVVAIACLGNWLAGALAAISAALWFDFFFTVPYDRLTISRSADVTTFVLLLAVGVAVSQMAAWARRLKAVTVADAAYFSRILASAALTQEAGTPDEVVQHVRRQLIEVLGLKDCRFEYGKLLGQPPRLEPDGSITTRHGHYPVDEFGLPEEEVELRAFSNGQYTGRFMLTPKPGFKPSQRVRLVAVTLAGLAGHAIGDSSARAA